VSKAPFVVLLLLLMGGGLLGLLLLNTALTEDAFQLHKLQQQSEALSEQEQGLSLKVDALSDPAALAARASELGMVPGGAPRFLPADSPLPPGARVIGTDPRERTALVVVPAPPAHPAPPAPSTGRGESPQTGSLAHTGTSAATGAATGTASSSRAAASGSTATVAGPGTAAGPER
jgi:hypothetical protein